VRGIGHAYVRRATPAILPRGITTVLSARPHANFARIVATDADRPPILDIERLRCVVNHNDAIDTGRPKTIARKLSDRYAVLIGVVDIYSECWVGIPADIRLSANAPFSRAIGWDGDAVLQLFPVLWSCRWRCGGSWLSQCRADPNNNYHERHCRKNYQCAAIELCLRLCIFTLLAWFFLNVSFVDLAPFAIRHRVAGIPTTLAVMPATHIALSIAPVTRTYAMVGASGLPSTSRHSTPATCFSDARGLARLASDTS
jgi:hypothetical protein